MKRILIVLSALFALASPALGANSSVPGMGAATSVSGTDGFYCIQSSGTVEHECTAAQTAAYVYGLMSGDGTASGTGALTLATVNSNVGSFGTATACVSFTVNAKGLITAASAATCTPAIGSITGLGTGVATFLATPSSANLLSALTTSTGTGNAVFATSPTLVTPNLGTPSAITLTSGTGLPLSTGITGFGTGVATLLGNASSGTGAPLGGTAPTMSSPTINTAATLGFVTGSTQCLQVNTSGAISGTGSACGGSGSTGANPTATAGPSAINGSATTFMRSDAAPAIQLGSASQAGIVEVDGSTITASAGVITAVPGVSSRTVTGATDTILAGDRGNVVYYNSSSSIAVTQPAPTGSFASNYFTTVCSINTGVATLTASSGKFGGSTGSTTYALPTNGTALNPACFSYQSDGTNFNVIPYWMVNAALLTAGTLPAGRMPALTGDCTTSAGAVATTCTKTNGTAFGALATVTPGTGVATAAAANLSASGGLTSTIASGTLTIPNTAVSSGTCGSAVTVSAANVATTDVVDVGFAADPTSTTGFLPSAMLTLVPYPTSGNVNVKACNLTGSSITPTSTTINFRVTR